MTLHVQCEKNVNVKLFNNGKIQMTGLKYETHGDKVLELLLPYLQRLENSAENSILSMKEPIVYEPFNIALINS